ncbi:hypothetical protein EJ03DRAFT_204088 [Teratosphaeria nubilosa]|uniref:Uncharacterized protein n=1 Tax=Teratosphaeria nubilosa TaxID=161662 RepID=A0A6G1LHR8_9PEZI|nr:hypothetical protein EJ03DRAFT_204088 [Teratosphaeria nubilosa]
MFSSILTYVLPGSWHFIGRSRLSEHENLSKISSHVREGVILAMCRWWSLGASARCLYPWTDEADKASMPV